MATPPLTPSKPAEMSGVCDRIHACVMKLEPEPELADPAALDASTPYPTPPTDSGSTWMAGSGYGDLSWMLGGHEDTHWVQASSVVDGALYAGDGHTWL